MSQATTAQPEKAAQPTVKTDAIILGKFNGAFCQFQLNAFYTMRHGGINSKVAHKIALDYGSDFGRLMASNADFASKVGKAKKNGESKLTISGGGYLQTSRAMSVVRVCQQIGNLYQEGLLEDVELPELSSTLTEYLTECEKWATSQNWEEKK